MDFGPPKQQGHMTRTNSLTLAVAFAALASLSAKAQSLIAYDNTTSYQNMVSSRGAIEIGDEINLIGGANTITSFAFEYNFTGTGAAPTAFFRIWDKTGAGGLAPGNLLLQSAQFTLEAGFHTVTLDNLSLAVPGTIIWTVDFDGAFPGSDNAGLLFYNGVGVGGGPGQSFDDHWENLGTVAAPNWVLADNAGVIDNFGARVTVVPEPGTIALFVGGAAVLGLAARRRKS